MARFVNSPLTQPRVLQSLTNSRQGTETSVTFMYSLYTNLLYVGYSFYLSLSFNGRVFFFGTKSLFLSLWVKRLLWASRIDELDFDSRHFSMLLEVCYFRIYLSKFVIFFTDFILSVILKLTVLDHQVWFFLDWTNSDSVKSWWIFCLFIELCIWILYDLGFAIFLFLFLIRLLVFKIWV